MNKDKWKLIIEQDDCAASPDFLEAFNKELSKHIGCNYTIGDFQKDSDKPVIDKEESSYYCGNHLLTISADDPYWKLYIKE